MGSWPGLRGVTPSRKVRMQRMRNGKTRIGISDLLLADVALPRQVTVKPLGAEKAIAVVPNGRYRVSHTAGTNLVSTTHLVQGDASTQSYSALCDFKVNGNELIVWLPDGFKLREDD